MKNDFIEAVKKQVGQVRTEISKRNTDIQERDEYIYGEKLETNLDIPIGHDKTPVNWLRRAVEIHRDQFMGRGFTMVSTYDTLDSDVEDPKEKKRIEIENQRRKARAESRRQIVDAIIRDNGGPAIFKDGAENASAVGFTVLKAWYDEESKKYTITPVEAVENFYSIWSRDNFRDVDANIFEYQVTETTAREMFPGVEIKKTSRLGKPNSTINTMGTNTVSNQEMVTVMEITGKVPGFGAKKGKIEKVPLGKENNMNVTIVDEAIVKVIDDEKRLPRYYNLPNKRIRRRPWGVADITDAMIESNKTYIETLSDWRTVAHKINFPKFKLYNFATSATLPRLEPRQIQGMPIGEGQDITLLQTGDPNSIDWKQQLDEIKEQFVRDAGISRVLFDDPSVDYNSSQALMTGMKATTDIAEAKKVLWEPILIQLFTDALEVIAEYDKNVKALLNEDESWNLKVKWPSSMQKEDPVFQQMLLNRFNSNTISLQTFLEEQGETKEEIDRIREEMSDPLTAAILSRTLQLVTPAAQQQSEPEPKVSVNLRGDLSPYQEANIAHKYGMNEGPFPPTAGPQGNQGRISQENQDNKEFLTDNAFKGGEPIQRGPDGQPVQPQVTATTAQNQEGTQPTSQPGSGQPAVSPQGAINQQNQNEGN